MADLRFENLSRRWDDGSYAVRDLNLVVHDGELVVLLGPSGCGKSTTLRLAAGLEPATGGRVLIGDDDVTGLAPQERNVAMVFQDYALYPHKSVRANLAFPLRMKGVKARERNERLQRVAELLGIEQLLERKPAHLSGGQRQRVALGRAIVRDPSAFLLDEPLSNLDVSLRLRMRAELQRLHRRLEAPILYVTHDQEEAMTLGDRVAVMREGVVEQVAPAMEVYRRPATLFVAGFVGTPPMNLLRGEIVDGRFEASHAASLRVPDHVTGEAAPKIVGVRPQDLRLVRDSQAELRAEVDVVEPVGNDAMVHFVHDGADPPLVATVDAERAPRRGDVVGLAIRPDRVHWFDAEGRRMG